MDWIWIFIGLAVIVIILAIAFSRVNNDNYSAGSGMFKNSDFNLDEDKKDFSEVEYFNKKGKMK